MNSSKTIRRSITTIAALALAIPAVAGAQPVGGGNGEPPEPVNHAPVAKFTITPNPALVTTQPQAQARAFPGVGDRSPVFGSGDLVKFDASASTDDEGITKYEWDLDGNGTYEKSGAALKTTSRRYEAVGSYTIKLRVSDDGGKTKVVSHVLTVHAPPKAQLVPDKTVALIGQQVNYNGAGSSDDNGIAKYEWDLDGDGSFETNSGTTPAASTSYTTIGSKSVKLKLTDVHGATGTAAVNVLVHRAPTAAFTIAPNPAIIDQAVTFDGSTSSDDDPIAKYEWDLDGDGSFETDTQAVATATKTYTTPGTVTVKLRTTDDHGVQDVVSHDVTVNPKPETTTTTTTTTTDTSAPQVRIVTRSMKLGRTGNVTVKIACPATETTCTGRLALRSLRGARSAALGGKAFSLAGGQTAKVKVHLSKKNRQAVKRLRRMKAQATARATDAAGNQGTTRKLVTIKR